MEEIPHPETPAEMIARSVFGFVLIALLTAIITWVWLMLSKPSPDPTFESMRKAIQVGSGIFVLILVGISFLAYRTKSENVLPASGKVAAVLNKKWIAIFLSVSLVEFNLVLLQLFSNIAPAITNPGKFLMISWTLLAMGLIFAVNRHELRNWLFRTRRFWIGFGLSTLLLIFIAILVTINSEGLRRSRIGDRLRGGLDYRQLTFFEDGKPAPSARSVWQEQSQTRLRWSPYSYWVLDEFHGDFFNIDASGVRQTPEFSGSQSSTIFVFGGSTAWGEGARDEYTIPGHIVRLLDEQRNPQRVVNYGQTGYVSTQDFILFHLQLANGNIPDIAIFYQGFNDVFSAWQQGLSGLTLQENMRFNDAEAGRSLRQGRPVFLLPDVPLQAYDLSLAGVGTSEPESIAERWFANMRMAQVLGEAYGVQTIFVWQPAIMFKSRLTEEEQVIYATWEATRPGLFELYGAVDTIVRQRAANNDSIILLSDLFRDQRDTLFFDLVHITEVGNALVAEALLPKLNAMLNQ